MGSSARYLVVLNDIKAKIDSEEWKPGFQIPSTAALCQQYSCSQTVIHQAVILLQYSGYLTGVPGLGRFVSQP